MKVFVAGASGALGRRLVPILVAAGHEVVGMTRRPEATRLVRELGAEPVVADGLDQAAVMGAVVGAGPEVVVHQMTALTGIKSFKKFDDEFALTNRLRTEGLDYLLDAAVAVGARRFIAQSFGNWNYERTGSPVKTEDDLLDSSPPARMSRTLAAIRYLESSLADNEDIEGIALRYANFYGPGSAQIAEDGAVVDQVRERRLPIIGDGAGVWSFIHYDDAATATMLALDRGGPGIYNIADDEPAPVSVWLPELAEALGAKRPRRVPVWVGRLAAGEPGVSLFTRIRGASNAKAKQELGWQLIYPSWRDGFRRGLADTPPPPIERD
jgi:nucleoside-diphosphate-sugar epimerase